MKRIFVTLGAIAYIFFMVQCSEDNNVNNPDDNPDEFENINSCDGCHTNYEALKALASPDTVEAGGGCSGETPHYEPYDRVYLNPDKGYTAYKTTAHGKMECTVCHNGTDDTDDKVLAHSGDFIAHPSTAAEEKCGSCHQNAVKNIENSIHTNGWGQKRKVTMRYGLNGPEEFEQLPDHMKEGYETNCAKCHASCGDCHVLRPKATGGGLLNGHNFTRKPDMRKTCTGCHSSRGGHAYYGEAAGTQPDVHLTKLGADCMFCHNKSDVHGSDEMHIQRYASKDKPSCTNCHSGKSDVNEYHQKHWDDLSCFVCHSQPYNNCGSCHIHGEGARVPSYQGFKIGSNPIQDVHGKNENFALVRRTLMAPDSWKEYGVQNLDNFDEFPIYNYTSPHNIKLKTTQCSPEDGKACFDACHVIKEADTLRNKELYLFESDLENEWQRTSSKKVTVDGKLPSSWGIK